MAASLVSFECQALASFTSLPFSSKLAELSGSNASAQALVGTVAGRMVSVRPCLKAAVLHDSYVGTLHLYCR